MKKNVALKDVEDVDVTFGEDVFTPKIMYCDTCDAEMIKKPIEIAVSQDVKVTVNTFRCPKGHEEMLGLEEAQKLDKALILQRFLSKEKLFSFKRRLSFDGSNYLFRLPTELTQGKHTEVRIIPLDDNEALIQW